MRPPEFWKADVVGRDAVPVLRALLTPVSWIYAWTVARRFRTTTPRHAPVPVICVGNFTVGGGGKTPVTRALRTVLGAGAHTLSRGYGGTIEGPLRVTSDMDAHEVGDEPLLHAADGPAWIARDRVAGARAAANGGARVIILDDGFQNPTLAKDLNIVVVDPSYGVGNGAVFPAGPLRETLAAGLARADAIVMLHPANAVPEPQTWLSGFAKPILHASLEPLAPPPAGKLVAFAGLARPEKFFDTLAAAGADVAEGAPYDDHHLYSDDDLRFLSELAQDYSAQLITTEKDAARLSPAWREKVAVLRVGARFHDDAALDALLQPIRSRMT
ncbi:tetraacyldisaccharide 4'-kinase [Terricaulis sp.]|uniref:tetraacyldisaccharide 4'-kinase n=1 Tax=Terricaulis sp. TaxID=2768686 RepID=UPI00378345C9